MSRSHITSPPFPPDQRTNTDSEDKLSFGKVPRAFPTAPLNYESIMGASASKGIQKEITQLFFTHEALSPEKAQDIQGCAWAS